MHFPPGENVWVEVEYHINQPIQQIEFAVDELRPGAVQASRVQLMAIDRNDARLAGEGFRGVSVVTLERVKYRGNLIIVWVWDMVILGRGYACRPFSSQNIRPLG